MATGCSSRTPEQTVAGFFQAIEDENYNKAKTYISNSMSEEAGDEDDFREMSETPNPEMGENPWGNEANLVSEITGDTAKVWHKDFDGFRWILIKEGGQWKIDDVDLDLSGMMDALEDLGMPEGMELPEGMTIPGG